MKTLLPPPKKNFATSLIKCVYILYLFKDRANVIFFLNHLHPTDNETMSNISGIFLSTQYDDDDQRGIESDDWIDSNGFADCIL